MTCRRLTIFVSFAALSIVPAMVTAGQAPAQVSPPAAPASAQPSRLWLTFGAASTTLLGDCTDCEDATYLHSLGVVGNAGVALNPRTDVGAEIFWVPATLSTREHIWSTFVMASVQFRPWQSRGFFVKGSGGMAFVRNWLNTIVPDAGSLRSKALALGFGAGWEWRTRSRVGFQVFGSQQVAALGDLATSAGALENVIGNFWSVGAGVVIR